MTLLAYIAKFEGEEWVTLVHGATRAKAKYRFLRVNPSSFGGGDYVDIRLTRLPGQDDKPFTYDNANVAGFRYDFDEDHPLPEETGWSETDCDCELCREKK